MTLAEAIRERRVITFVYDGLPRTVHPAALGFHVSTGNRVLRGYQVAGMSSSRLVPLWDLFSVEKMQDLVVTATRFESNPPKYSPDDKHISPIEAQLA